MKEPPKKLSPTHGQHRWKSPRVPSPGSDYCSSHQIVVTDIVAAIGSTDPGKRGTTLVVDNARIGKTNREAFCLAPESPVQFFVIEKVVLTHQAYLRNKLMRNEHGRAIDICQLSLDIRRIPHLGACSSPTDVTSLRREGPIVSSPQCLHNMRFSLVEDDRSIDANAVRMTASFQQARECILVDARVVVEEPVIVDVLSAGLQVLDSSIVGRSKSAICGQSQQHISRAQTFPMLLQPISQVLSRSVQGTIIHKNYLSRMSGELFEAFQTDDRVLPSFPVDNHHGNSPDLGVHHS